MNDIEDSFKPIDFPPLTKEQEALIERLKNVKPEEIDTSEMSECEGTGGLRYAKPLKVPRVSIKKTI